MRAVWVYGAASSTHPRCFVPSWRTSTIEMMGSFGVNNNLIFCFGGEKAGLRFFGSKNMVCFIFKSYPYIKFKCHVSTNRFRRDKFNLSRELLFPSKPTHTHTQILGFFNCVPLAKNPNHRVFFVSIQTGLDRGDKSRKTMKNPAFTPKISRNSRRTWRIPMHLLVWISCSLIWILGDSGF